MASSYSRRWFVSRLGLIGCTLPLTASAQRLRSHRVGRIGFLGLIRWSELLLSGFLLTSTTCLLILNIKGAGSVDSSGIMLVTGLLHLPITDQLP